MIPRFAALLRPMTVAFALVPTLGQAAPPASSALCYEVADDLWSDVAPGEARGQSALSLLTVPGKPGFVMRSESGDAAITGARGSLRQVLANDFKAPPELLAKIDALPNRNVIRIGRSDVWVLDTVEGTAECDILTGVVLPQAGDARETMMPIGRGDGDLCGAFVAGVSVGGKDALWTETEGYFSTDFSRSDIEIRPLEGDSWQPPCTLTVRYALDFVASQAFCDGIDCEPLMKSAEVIARRRNAGDDATVLGAATLPADAVKQQAYYKRLSDLAAAEAPPFILPTFGQSALSPYTEFSDSITFPLFAGSLYLARLGHGRFGWRNSPDYLLALYTIRDAHLVPVAGIYLEATRRTITAVKVTDLPVSPSPADRSRSAPATRE